LWKERFESVKRVTLCDFAIQVICLFPARVIVKPPSADPALLIEVGSNKGVLSYSLEKKRKLLD